MKLRKLREEYFVRNEKDKRVMVKVEGWGTR